MLKKLAILVLIGLISPILSVAQIKIENPLQADTFQELIDNLLNFLFTLALALFPLMIVIAGLYFVTAGGDPEKVKTAKNIILYTVVGFLIILLAKGFIAFLKQVL